jgi:hypothetical protein
LQDANQIAHGGFPSPDQELTVDPPEPAADAGLESTLYNGWDLAG